MSVLLLLQDEAAENWGPIHCYDRQVPSYAVILKDKQEEAMLSFAQGHDTFVSLLANHSFMVFCKLY